MSSLLDTVWRFILYRIRKVREAVQEIVRSRVNELLALRPDLSDEAFGAAVGRGYSWVRAFRTGTRHANELKLVVKIAKVLNVSVGYLLNETEKAKDAKTVALVTAWEQVADEQARDTIVGIVRAFAGRSGAQNTESKSGSTAGAAAANGNTKPAKKDR